jgi:hypothetical protein
MDAKQTGPVTTPNEPIKATEPAAKTADQKPATETK